MVFSVKAKYHFFDLLTKYKIFNMQTIVCKEPKLHGKAMILPHAGQVEVSKDGTLEVEDNVAELLVNGGGGTWKYDGEEEIGEVEKIDEDTAMAIEALANMSVEDMLELAENANIKGAKALAKKPEALRNFIKNKLKRG